MARRYRSSIPHDAAERVVEHHPGGEQKKAEYLLGSEVVGIRYFHETGEPEFEYALGGGKRHGIEYCWAAPGELLSAIPYANGLGHGTARQWVTGRQVRTWL